MEPNKLSKFTKSFTAIMKKMNNLNEQLFQELDDTFAAWCNGGTLYLYEDPGFKGRKIVCGTKDFGCNIGDLNNKISSIKITGNEKWAFYKNDNYIDYLTSLQGGNPDRKYDVDDLIASGIPDNSISSFRRIA